MKGVSASPRSFLLLTGAVAAISCNESDPASPSESVLSSRVPMLVTSARGGNVDIYVMDADGSNARRLTTDPATDQGGDWSPEGFQLAFMSFIPNSGGVGGSCCRKRAMMSTSFSVSSPEVPHFGMPAGEP